MGFFGKKNKGLGKKEKELEKSRTEKNRDSITEKRLLLQKNIGNLEQKIDQLYKTGIQLKKREQELKDAYREYHAAFNEFEEEQRLDEIARIQEDGANLKKLRAKLNNALNICRSANADLGNAEVTVGMAGIAEHIDFRLIEEMVAEAEAMEDSALRYASPARDVDDPLETGRRTLKEELLGGSSAGKKDTHPGVEHAIYDKRRKNIFSE